jgi:hypothetical protein
VDEVDVASTTLALLELLRLDDAETRVLAESRHAGPVIDVDENVGCVTGAAVLPIVELAATTAARTSSAATACVDRRVSRCRLELALRSASLSSRIGSWAGGVVDGVALNME